MLDVDIRDKNLMDRASYMALKMGHFLSLWVRDTIVYGSRHKKNRKFVDTYLSECKHCGTTIRVSGGLEDQIVTELFDEACEMNTGYEDRVIPNNGWDGCAGILRINHDSHTAYLKECA